MGKQIKFSRQMCFSEGMKLTRNIGRKQDYLFLLSNLQSLFKFNPNRYFCVYILPRMKIHVYEICNIFYLHVNYRIIFKPLLFRTVKNQQRHTQTQSIFQKGPFHRNKLLLHGLCRRDTQNNQHKEFQDFVLYFTVFPFCCSRR